MKSSHLKTNSPYACLFRMYLFLGLLPCLSNVQAGPETILHSTLAYHLEKNWQQLNHARVSSPYSFNVYAPALKPLAGTACESGALAHGDSKLWQCYNQAGQHSWVNVDLFLSQAENAQTDILLPNSQAVTIHYAPSSLGKMPSELFPDDGVKRVAASLDQQLSIQEKVRKAKNVSSSLMKLKVSIRQDLDDPAVRSIHFKKVNGRSREEEKEYQQQLENSRSGGGFSARQEDAFNLDLYPDTRLQLVATGIEFAGAIHSLTGGEGSTSQNKSKSPKDSSQDKRPESADRRQKGGSASVESGSLSEQLPTVPTYRKPEGLKAKEWEKILNTLAVKEEDIKWLGSVNGGMTNKNHKLLITSGSQSGRALVLRLPGEGVNRMINRARELKHVNTLQKTGIDADTVYFNAETGVKLTVFIEGKTFSGKDIPENFDLITGVLQRLHNIPTIDAEPFKYLENLNLYEELARTAGTVFPDDYDSIKQAVQNNISALKRLSGMSLCHNDLVAENMMLSKGVLHLIDWEYSGTNDPMFDLASCALESKLSEEQTEALLTSYFRRKPSPDEVNRVRVWQQAQDLLWAVWAFYKSKKGDESVLEYGMERFRRLRSHFDHSGAVQR